MKKILLAAGAALLAATVSASADQPAAKPAMAKAPHGPELLVKKLDTNGDGTVDRDEFVAGAVKKQQQRFEKLDANGDGALSLDEFTASTAGQADGMFKRLDADGDGKLTEADEEARRNRPRVQHLAPAPADAPPAGSAPAPAPAE